MTDKYQTLRDGMPELQREAARKGGYNPRAQMIIDLLAERDALQAENERLREKVGLIICDECHAKCSEPHTGLFASQRPDEEPCILCECSSLRGQLASRGGVPEPVVTDEMVERVAKLQAAHEEEIFCVRQDRDAHFGELMRALEQVDALKAERDKLRAAMIEAKSYIEHYMYGGSAYREPAAKAVALIDDAMQEANP